MTWSKVTPIRKVSKRIADEIFFHNIDGKHATFLTLQQPSGSIGTLAYDRAVAKIEATITQVLRELI